MSLLRLEDVSLNRGGNQLFDAVNLSMLPGSVTVVLGGNGTGKSSLLQLMAGLLTCDGRVELMGKRLNDYSRQQIAMKMAWLGALPPTDFGLTVRQRLSLACDGLEASESNILEAACAMDMMQLLERSLGALSSGERQRAELAALMLRDVPLWLVDEPTAHLDLKHQMRCLKMLGAQRQTKRGVVVVLHDLQQAQALLANALDQVVLFDGRGGIRLGSAELLHDEQVLSQVFEVSLQRLGGYLVPNYGGNDEITR